VTNADGTRVAFHAKGDYDGQNPDHRTQIYLATCDTNAELTITSFTAAPTQGTVIVTNVPVSFIVVVNDASLVQNVTWDFDGNGTPDATGPKLTSQFTYTQAGTYTAKVTVTATTGGAAQADTVVTVLSPDGALADALSKVQGLTLDSGTKQSLTSKLTDARALIAKGNNTGACGKLNDFVNQMNSLVKTGKLSSQNAAPILGEVQSVRASLGCK
jgi:PKD repeat protein